MQTFLGNIDSRVRTTLFISNGVLLTIFFLNNILPWINTQNDLWSSPYIFPYIDPIGTDFREGLFYPAKIFLQGKSPYTDYSSIYPPFTILFALPFRLFEVQVSYIIQVILLFVANIAAISLSLKIGQQVIHQSGEDKHGTDGFVKNLIFLQIAFLTITSYGFLFSIERGNYDIYPMVFSLLAIWVLVTKPSWIWIQVLLISVATHLKLYPAILFSIVIWKHRWKSVIPIILLNLALLFITGPSNAIDFIKTVITYSENPFIWIGNHSAASFNQHVNQYLSQHNWSQLPNVIFTLTPLALWAIGAFVLYRRKYNNRNVIWLFVLSVPLMNLIPSTSHDYKLVLLSSPLAILLFILMTDYFQRGNNFNLILITLLMVIMFPITRSYTMLPLIFKNKYPFILLLQFIILITIFVRSPDKFKGDTT